MAIGFLLENNISGYIVAQLYGGLVHNYKKLKIENFFMSYCQKMLSSRHNEWKKQDVEHGILFTSFCVQKQGRTFIKFCWMIQNILMGWYTKTVTLISPERNVLLKAERESLENMTCVPFESGIVWMYAYLKTNTPYKFKKKRRKIVFSNTFRTH